MRIKVKTGRGGYCLQQQRILAIVTIHILSKKIFLKQKYAGGAIFKKYHASPGGPAV